MGTRYAMHANRDLAWTVAYGVPELSDDRCVEGSDGNDRSVVTHKRFEAPALAKEDWMRFVIVVALLIGLAARAGEPESALVVRPLLGIGAVLSDAGAGLTAQAGVRVSPVLLRLTLDVGGGTTRRGYIATSLRPAWLWPLRDDFALATGLGLTRVTYGFIFDSPTASFEALSPELVLLLGQNRWFGRLLLAISGFVPLGSVSRARDSAGQQIAPPVIMGTALLSI
jgi:hypothetical protein